MKVTLPLLFTILIIAFIGGAIWPGFLAVAVLGVFIPFTGVCGPINVEILAKAMSFIVSPFSNIDVSICMNEPASSKSFIILPVAIVQGPIRPHLLPTAVLGVGLSVPAALVLSPIRQHHLHSLHSPHSILRRGGAVVERA
jgi:hypothetical protein